jgi:P-type Ca2+ transporter type 2C
MPKRYEGLSTKEVQKLLQEYGPNELQESNKVTPLQILFRQVKSNFMVYMLFIAAITSFAVGKGVTGYTILVVILCVIVVGFVQEYKAEEAVNSLKGMLAPISIAIRDGHKVEVPSKDLVPGDILVLGNGEKIPADAVILEGRDLRLNEAALTGESGEVTKTAPEDPEKFSDDNMLFMGTYIVNGKCFAKVVHTGMNTKFGEIAHLISTAEKDLPLQEKVNGIAKFMVVVSIIFSFATAALMVLGADIVTRELLIDALILMIAICVSAFPEGFPVVLITTLAVGSKRMAEKNVIVNRMSIIETLGETTMICSDKTGTITRGEMTIKFMFTNEELYEIGGSGYIAHGDITKEGKKVDPKSNPTMKTLLESIILCNDADIERTGEDNEYRALGTPTEAALLILGAKAEMFKEDFSGEIESEYPFNSDRKMMSVLYSNEQEEHFVYAKGAPEVLLDKCTKMMKNGKEVSFGSKEREKLEEIQQEMAKHAFRTLAVAYKKLGSLDRDYGEEEFVFLGVVAMEDSPREEIAESIQTALNAGIRVKMITGDAKETAEAIAKQVGLEGETLRGKEIDHMSDEELSIALKDTAMFARVTPEHKLRIVRLLKAQDEIVAMTGDGVNDAPALREAHVGIAMGKNGTDVSRSAADLTLKDDNFASIISAVAEGRTIYNNIRKFVSYQLTVNTAELVVLLVGVILAPVLGWQIPLLLSIQILFMNLVTDNIPAITLGLNPTSHDIMNEQPRKSRNILNRSLIILIAFSGTMMALFALTAYYLDFNVFGESAEYARTTALLSMILMEIVAAFSFRSFRKKALTRSPFVNMSLVYASLISLGATLAIIYTPIKTVFGTVPLGLIPWGIAAISALTLITIYDVAKHLFNKQNWYLRDTR